MIYRFDPQNADKALKTLASLPPSRSLSLDIVSSQVKHHTDLLGMETKAFRCFHEKERKKSLWMSAHSISEMNRFVSFRPEQVLKAEGLVCLAAGHGPRQNM